MSIEQFKKQAKLIKKRAVEMEVKLSYQQGLELIAVINGFKTWNALEASFKKEEKPVTGEYSYWRLDYFYDRKNSGSFYAKINNQKLKEAIKVFYEEESSVIHLAEETGQIDKSDCRSISFVEEISEEEYLECTI